MAGKSLQVLLTERLPRYSVNPQRNSGFKVYEFDGDSIRSYFFGELSAERVADGIIAAMPKGAVVYDMDDRVFRMRSGERGCGQDTYLMVLAHPDFPKVKEGGSFPPAGQLKIQCIGLGMECKVEFIEPEAITA